MRVVWWAKFMEILFFNLGVILYVVKLYQILYLFLQFFNNRGQNTVRTYILDINNLNK